MGTVRRTAPDAFRDRSAISATDGVGSTRTPCRTSCRSPRKSAEEGPRAGSERLSILESRREKKVGRSRPGKPSREPVAGASLGSRKPGAKQGGAQPSRQAEPNGSRSEHRSVSRRRMVRPRKIGPGPCSCKASKNRAWPLFLQGPCSCSIGPWQSTNPATTGCPLAARDCRPPQPRESRRTRGERRSHSNGRRVVAASVLPRRPRRWRRRKRLAGTSAPHPGHCFAGAESRNDHQFSRVTCRQGYQKKEGPPLQGGLRTS